MNDKNINVIFFLFCIILFLEYKLNSAIFCKL